MKLNIAVQALSASLILFGGAVGLRAQQTLPGNAKDFTSVEYFDPPNEQQMKTRMSGADAQSLSPGAQSNGLVAIRQLKLETFGVDGKTQLVAHAPECTYDAINGVASSPGKIQLQSGDGKFRVDGEGFLWRRDEQSLTISNEVRTVIIGGLTAPKPEAKVLP